MKNKEIEREKFHKRMKDQDKIKVQKIHEADEDNNSLNIAKHMKEEAESNIAKKKGAPVDALWDRRIASAEKRKSATNKNYYMKEHESPDWKQ